MPQNNAIGDRGESIFNTRVTQDNLFKVYFMGEKAPIVDFLLEILDDATPYYFMVQVKGTTQGYQVDGNLQASVEESKMIKLLERKMPTYVAGVDVNDEIVYLCPAFDINTRYPSIPTNHYLKLSDKPGSRATLDLLKQDVINFWDNSNMSNFKSSYVSLL